MRGFLKTRIQANVNAEDFEARGSRVHWPRRSELKNTFEPELMRQEAARVAERRADGTHSDARASENKIPFLTENAEGVLEPHYM
jgi:hypothetical protein